MPNEEQLAALCASYLEAKSHETAANENRVNIEKEIIALTGCPEEGSQSVEIPGFKIGVTQKITRKIDAKAWGLVVEQIPQELRPVSIKEELVVEGKGVRWLKEHEPGYYKLLCTAMEEKPAKPSIKVEAK